MEATGEQLAKLAPFLNGAKPDERGEAEMYCPLHNDTRRSASINVKMGVWYCHASCGGGSIRRLIDAEDTWVPPEGRVSAPSVAPGFSSGILRRPTRKQVRRWSRRLMNTPQAMNLMKRRRDLDPLTLVRARIGWDGSYFKIPVFSPERKLWNVRTWDPDPKDDRRKIWSVRGMGRARLYPSSQLDLAEEGDAILLCEGEWDALLAIQMGYLAVSRTDGAGKPWKREWDVAFAGLRVFMIHDRDIAGAQSNAITETALAGVAKELHTVHLPYEHEKKHGKDLTDFVMDTLSEGDNPTVALGELLRGATNGSRGTRMRTGRTNGRSRGNGRGARSPSVLREDQEQDGRGAVPPRSY